MEYEQSAMDNIIHIVSTFKTIDGVPLFNRYMCIVMSDERFLYMLPLTSFDKKSNKRNKILELTQNLEYIKLDGNTKNGFIKLDQCYKMHVKDRREGHFSFKMRYNFFINLSTRFTECKEKKLNMWQKILEFEE